MMLDSDTEEWLRALPLGTPVAIDGVEVWLKTFAVGAELGGYVLHGFSEAELQNALRLGFRCAIEFDAGFALSPDGSSLCLSRWLPGIGSWVDAAEPLEQLLNQIDMLRENCDPARNALSRNPVQERTEQRMRKLLEGGIK